MFFLWENTVENHLPRNKRAVIHFIRAITPLLTNYKYRENVFWNGLRSNDVYTEWSDKNVCTSGADASENYYILGSHGKNIQSNTKFDKVSIAFISFADILISSR